MEKNKIKKDHFHFFFFIYNSFFVSKKIDPLMNEAILIMIHLVKKRKGFVFVFFFQMFQISLILIVIKDSFFSTPLIPSACFDIHLNEMGS